ncbi:PREDICTED: TNF receptor-associated factor 1-like, partial [Gekko japonicus]|uniref:TNF receptor-associated factor n=1 Tax=Gekko japonicus TaxID=146911 RepID=A0ABM1LCW3_GEKJA
MAEGRSRSSSRRRRLPTSANVSSFPDDNEVPSGYPLSLCEDGPEPKYLCSHCKSVLRRALQTVCGHRYCKACLAWIVRNHKNPVCQSCKEEEPDNVDEETLLSIEKAFSDAAINKEISELSVHCVVAGCTWTGVMKAVEGHQSTCEYARIPCHTGCGQEVMRKELAEHLQHECVSATLHSSCHQKVSDPKHQTLSAASTDEDDCRFSRIGCPFRGNRKERQEHEKSAAGMHLALLLQHAKQLKGNLHPAGGGADSCLQAAKALNGIFRSLQLTAALDTDSSPGLPLYEGESSWQALLRGRVVPLLDSKLRVFENIVSVLSKEMDASRQKIAAFRGQRGLDQDTIRGLELKLADLQRCLAQKEVTLGRLQQKLLLSTEATYNGIFLWKIKDVHQKCYEAVSGKVCSLQSPAFYTSRYGYKLCMRLYLNGEGRGKGTHVSVFLVLLKGEYDTLLQWPFVHKITFMLLDQNNGDHLMNTFYTDPTAASSQRPVTDMNEASGCPRFLSLAKLQSMKYTYLKDGTLFLKCIAEPSFSQVILIFELNEGIKIFMGINSTRWLNKCCHFKAHLWRQDSLGLCWECICSTNGCVLSDFS